MRAYVHASMHVCTRTHTHTYIYIYIYIYIYNVHMYIYIYIYIFVVCLFYCLLIYIHGAAGSFDPLKFHAYFSFVANCVRRRCPCKLPFERIHVQGYEVVVDELPGGDIIEHKNIKAHIRRHIHTHTCLHTCMHACVHACTCGWVHACKNQTYTHMNANVPYIHEYMQTPTAPHTRIHYIHAHIHPHTRAHT